MSVCYKRIVGDVDGHGIELMRVMVDSNPRIVHGLRPIAQVDETGLLLVIFLCERVLDEEQESCEQQ